MDLYRELEDLSESVYDCDITCEKLNENVSAALNNILNMSEDSWKGDAQFAFLEEFSKWVDNSTKIKFGANESFKIVKELKTKSSINKKENDEIVICLYGLEDDDKIRVTLIGNGSISSEYKVNDIEHPISNRKEKEEGFDVAIKQNISTEEMEELISKARSIYSVFQEIAEEYNKSLE